MGCGPHKGAGSGAPLNFLISKWHTRLERLTAFRDAPDSESSDED